MAKNRTRKKSLKIGHGRSRRQKRRDITPEEIKKAKEKFFSEGGIVTIISIVKEAADNGNYADDWLTNFDLTHDTDEV